MDEMETRLIRCFSSVFPDLTTEQIRSADMETVPAWDSLAAVTLVAILQEEFGLQINLMDLPELVSFVAVQNYVRKHNVVS
ncbi:MAG TPA: acyl carrier protein [Candidatus Sulfotelmatobacter sp.]|jgi:acyl carrier protein|nr:acyl carrier protein [Candidatus Sulfotelmatobacter sp.]